MRQRLSVGIVHTEYANAQSSDGRRHPVTVEFKLLQAGRPNIFTCIHLDAVDDRMKIFFAQTKAGNNVCQALESCWNFSGIERVDILSPCRERCETLRPRHVVI